MVLEGDGREEDQGAAQEAGFNLPVTKPIDPIRLRRLLATLG